jgi:ABC-type sugar transport system permease subunit
MSNGLSPNESIHAKASLREKLGAWVPGLAIAPGAVASLIYVFGFTLWTLYISMSNSTMLPTYKFVGLNPYFDLWSNARWKLAYGTLLFQRLLRYPLSRGRSGGSPSPSISA